MSVANPEDDESQNLESDSDQDVDSEPSYYENLVKGREFYLDERVGLESLKATCLACNLSGTFLVTGSRDGTLRCVNFDKWSKGGFGDFWKKKLEQSVNGIAFNNDEAVIGVASGNMLHFYTDGGDDMVSTTKGDMYLLGAKKTKGHTSTVTCVANDPKSSNYFASGSLDGTVRLFDILANKQNISLSLNNNTIYTLSNKYSNRAGGLHGKFGGKARMGKVGISTLCYANSNFKPILVAGNELGKVVVWDYKTSFQNLNIDAHEDEVECVVSQDDNKVISRSNGCVKFWDLKSPKQPYKELSLPSSNGVKNGQSLALSPDNLHLLINTSEHSTPNDNCKSDKSEVWVYDFEKSDVVQKLKLESAVGPMVWAYETNQLFGSCLNGKIYSRCTDEMVGANYYQKAAEALEKKNKYAKVNTISAKPESYPIDFLPDDLVEVEDGVLKRRRVEQNYGIPKQEKDDYYTYGKTPITYEDDDIVTKLRSQAQEDTKKELKREGVGKIPYRADKFMAIYKKTQPNLILDFTKPKTMEEKMLLGVSKCPRCGIKICQCGYMDGK